MNKLYGLLAVNILLLVSGQTLWKIGLNSTALQFNLSSVIKLLMNVYIFSGLVLYGFATMIWFYILSKADLSLIYPLQSLCYVAAAFAAILIFKEKVPPTRWAGILLIVLGAYFVSKK